MGTVPGNKRARPKVGVGAPDPSLTECSGMAAVSELCDRLDLVAALDTAVGAIKTRDRGVGAGGLLVGLAAAQLAGQDHLVGLDRHRDDAVAQRLHEAGQHTDAAIAATIRVSRTTLRRHLSSPEPAAQLISSTT